MLICLLDTCLFIYMLKNSLLTYLKTNLVNDHWYLWSLINHILCNHLIGYDNQGIKILECTYTVIWQKIFTTHYTKPEVDRTCGAVMQAILGCLVFSNVKPCV